MELYFCIVRNILDKLARNSIWTFEIQIKLSSSGFGCGHGSLMFFACMEQFQCLFLSNMIQLSHFTCFLLHKWEHTNTVTETCCKCCRNTVSLLSVYDDVGSSWQFLQCISDDTQINCDKSANNPVHIQTVTFKRNAHLATTFALCILPVLQEYNQNANSWHLSWVPTSCAYW